LSFDIGNVIIEPLSSLHRRGAFRCQDIGIQNFCRYGIESANQTNTIRAFVAREPPGREVLGFYYLLTGSIEHDKTTEGHFPFIDRIPIVYIGMFGVHTPLRKMGIGVLMMRDLLKRVLIIAENAGVRLLMLDAVNEEAAIYYERKFDFQRVVEGGLQMFLTLGTIMDLNFP
jgi:GNAT superfamily N-acetyltransferase